VCLSVCMLPAFDARLAHAPNDHLRYEIGLQIMAVRFTEDQTLILIVGAEQATRLLLLLVEQAKRGNRGLWESGLEPGSIVGMKPTRIQSSLSGKCESASAEKFHTASLGRRMRMRADADLSISYMGWAVKRPAPLPG
jgi:hypothetical protein